MPRIEVKDLKLAELPTLNSEVSKQMVGGAELLTNTRYYLELESPIPEVVIKGGY
jgi:hypothetical protein